MTSTERLFTTWVTSLDGGDHAVTDEECVARLAENRGSFEAICGVVFLPGPMEGEPQVPCGRCVAILAARAAMRDVPERMGPRREGRLWRLLRGLKRPAGADGDLPPDASASAGDHGERPELGAPP